MRRRTIPVHAPPTPPSSGIGASHGTELPAVAEGAAALGNLAPVAVLLTQWRHTAEVHADPVLLEIPTREPEGDLGPVPAPPGTQ